jgi:hypothetical protein
MTIAALFYYEVIQNTFVINCLASSAENSISTTRKENFLVNSREEY